MLALCGYVWSILYREERVLSTQRGTIAPANGGHTEEQDESMSRREYGGKRVSLLRNKTIRPRNRSQKRAAASTRGNTTLCSKRNCKEQPWFSSRCSPLPRWYPLCHSRGHVQRALYLQDKLLDQPSRCFSVLPRFVRLARRSTGKWTLCFSFGLVWWCKLDLGILKELGSWTLQTNVVCARSRL